MMTGMMAGGTLVIGYGSSLRGDDGAGPFVARQLGAGAMVCHQLTPEFAEPISRARRVIFVDAHAGVAAGEIVIQSVDARASAGIHQFDPGTLLAWSQQLYGRAPEAFLIGMGGASFEFGDGLSAAAMRAAGRALRAIRKLGGGRHC
jgi:hydrogenase maturation protease